MSSGRARLGGVAGAGVGALAGVADKPAMLNGSDAVLLPEPLVVAPKALPPELELTEANGSALAEKATIGLAAERLAAAGAAPKGSAPKGSAPEPAADGAGAAPNGSAPKASGAAAAGASLEVEKVDQTSAPGEPDSSQSGGQLATEFVQNNTELPS